MQRVVQCAKTKKAVVRLAPFLRKAPPLVPVRPVSCLRASLSSSSAGKRELRRMRFRGEGVAYQRVRRTLPCLLTNSMNSIMAILAPSDYAALRKNPFTSTKKSKTRKAIRGEGNLQQRAKVPGGGWGARVLGGYSGAECEARAFPSRAAFAFRPGAPEAARTWDRRSR